MTTSTKTPQASLRRSAFLFASCAVLTGTIACTGETGSGTEPDPQPTAEPSSSPEANADQHLGSITVRVFDDTDTVVCERSLTSTQTEPNSAFEAFYAYGGILDEESASVIAGTPQADLEGTKVASALLVLAKTSDGIHDLPPSQSHVWTTAELIEANGFIVCSDRDDEQTTEGQFILAFDQANAGFELTNLAATVSSADPLPAFDDGWSVPLFENCGEAEVSECQAFAASGAYSITFTGTGENAADDVAYRFEATIDLERGDIVATREAE